jgi:hypothetical protein
VQDHGCRGSAKAYFAAFDRKSRRTWIDASDFVAGVAALDPLTLQVGGQRHNQASCSCCGYVSFACVCV